MEGKSKDMQDVFCRLTDKNRDVILVVARSLKMAQETAEQSLKPSETVCIRAAANIHNCDQPIFQNVEEETFYAGSNIKTKTQKL